MTSHLSFTLNGQRVQVRASPSRRLIDAIRQDLGLTGTKEGCGEGTCGCCTVILNRVAVNSCQVPLSRVQGAQVTTIEGIGSPDNPHSIQQAFVEAGAIQCGFCTPGMVVAAKALLDSNSAPTRQQVISALKGHFCRCTGYVRIVDAILMASTGIEGKEIRRPLTSSVLGGRVPSPEAIFKATGTAKYASDLTMPGMLYGEIVRSSRRHARILSIDPGPALKLKGVVRVLTAKDIPGENSFGFAFRDQPVLCHDRVRWRGDPVAVVVATDLKTAKRACRLIKLKYEPLPELLTPEDALKAGAISLHPGQGNIMPPFQPSRFSIGDVEEGFRRSQVVIERTYRTQRVEHAYMEPEAGLAYIDEEDRIAVAIGTQSPFDDREEIAHALGGPVDRVRVVQTFTGGAFGGKYDAHLAILLALCSYHTGRPVKIAYSRRESLLASGKRHPFTFHYKTGAAADGRLQAIKVVYQADTGAYSQFGPIVTLVGPLHATGPYRCPNVLIEGKAIFTNNPPSSAMRGFGTPQFHFAFESQMDLLADALKMDPLEFRLINALEAGDATHTGHVLTASVGLKKCLEVIRPHYLRLRAAARLPGEYRSTDHIKTGVGLACTWFGVGKTGYHDTAEAWLELRRDGAIYILTGAADCGQGQGIALRQIAGEALGVGPETLKVVSADTALTPNAEATCASRTLYSSGTAVLKAARSLKAILIEEGARLMGEEPEEVALRADHLESASGRRLTLKELANVCAEEGRPLRAVGRFDPPVRFDAATGMGTFFPTFAFGAHVAEVQVDTLSGRVTVKRVAAAHDVGRAVNLNNIEGQIEGGIVMGMGFTLSERFVPDETRRLADYRLPTMEDVPEIRSIIVEDPEPTGPFGVKGIGEPPLLPICPAIINAIEEAIGIRVYDLPADEKRIVALLQGRAQAD